MASKHFYPYNIRVDKLPVYLFGIGAENQDFVERPEGYPTYQIIYSNSGEGYLKFDNKTVRVPEDSFFFLPANYPHEYGKVTDTWEAYWAAFLGDSVDELMSRLELMKPCVKTFSSSAGLVAIFNKMFNATKYDKAFGDYTCSCLLYEYIIEFHKQILSEKTESSPAREILLPAINYINEHFGEDIPLSFLSEISGITPQYLCRLFRSTVNMSPMEYLTHRRVQEAKERLISSTLMVCDIAERCGFSNASYFCSVFKKHEGMTPEQYRRRYRTVG